MSKQIILDTETTGLEYKQGHRVIEIGCVEIENRKLSGREFHTYLNPGRESDPEALKIHGLTSEFLQDKPSFNEVYKDFIKFIKGHELLIHNADFDIGFLDNEIKLLSKELPRVSESVERVIDTLHVAREKHPGQRNSLDALVDRYSISGFDRDLHGALLDSKILASVYLSMTGGQTNLTFSVRSEKTDKQKNSKGDHKYDERPLVIKLSESEIQENAKYLIRMEEETGKKPIWSDKESKELTKNNPS
tara:strand:+ start:22935 stop:23678 length:744 start_codon:yes stop_codon:yes gene_type:complete